MLKEENILKCINTIIEDFLKDYFGLEWNWDLRINNRVKNSLGLFYPPYLDEETSYSSYIEISGTLIKWGTCEGILGTMLHEALHYALCELNTEYDDDTPIFENFIYLFGLPSNTQHSKSSCPEDMYEVNFSNPVYASYICPRCKSLIHEQQIPVKSKPKTICNFTCSSCFGQETLSVQRANRLIYKKSNKKKKHWLVSKPDILFEEDYNNYLNRLKKICKE